MTAITSNNLLSKSKDVGGSFIHSYGTKVFMRPRLDDVLDAVQQARFNEKKYVWVEDSQNGYVRAHVIHEDEQQAEIELENGLTRHVPISKVYPMNPPKFDMVDDMAELTHLNEPSVIHNLSVRYQAKHIYTYSGLFLVAVNPYRQLPIYSDEYVQNYKGRRRGEMPPHIYAVADQAYHDMLQDRENQSILITGESGAGKTENTKIVIQYLTTVASDGTRTETSQLEQQILQANPILEAFGNAQTIRNNNSSRFGKFIRIEFNMRAQICGANIEWYLLEKSRVHQQSPKERNYHIFYQLLSADESIKEQLLLGNGRSTDYGFTKHSRPTIDGVDDGQAFRQLMTSLDIMGLSDKEKLDYFRIVAVVLHLGNIVITPDYRGDRADIRDFAVLERVCHLLGIPAQEFKKCLLSPRIKAGRDWVNQAKSPAQVTASLDALAKSLYERNFASLVERVNRAIDGQKPADKMGFIGVLDIAGFEIFEVNSFEQLCINYTNEKLQQFFNHNMFVLEQEEYQKEKIDWSYINFGLDLQPTIDLIEKTNPVGILSCLEEECVAPRGTDKRFLDKLSEVWDNDTGESKFKTTRFKDGFIVRHYAGDVEYSTIGWIDKNKDPLNEDITRLLAQSSQRHVATLYEDYLTEEDDNSWRHGHGTSGALTLLKLRKGGGSFRTVGQRHKQQLLSLMNTLYMTHPHFVRCILPNNRKRPGEIQSKLVLDQLRCNGVLEGIRICRKGFPNRLSFADFRKRYEVLCPNVLPPNAFIDGRSACQTLLDCMELDHDRYRIGTTKVFFKATVLADLEEARDKKLGEYITRFQAMCRRYIARRHISRVARQTEAIKVMQRNARIYVTLREWPWWKVYAKLKPLNVAYRVETQIKEKDQKILRLETELKTQKEQVACLSERTEELESQQQDYKELLRSEQLLTQELQDSKQSLLDKVTNSEERVESLCEALDEARDQNCTLQQQLEAAYKENKAQAGMIARLHQDIREYNDDNEKLALQYKSLREEHENVLRELALLKKEHASLSQHNTSLEQAFDDQRAHVEKLEADLVETRSKEHALKKTNTEQSKQIMNLEKEKEIQQKTQNQKIAETTASVEAMKLSLRESSHALEKEKAGREEAQKETKSLKEKIDKLQNTHATERNEWQQRNEQLEDDRQQLVSLLQAEAADAAARAARLDQALAQLHIKIPPSSQ